MLGFSSSNLGAKVIETVETEFLLTGGVSLHVHFLVDLLMNFLKIFVSVDFDEVKNVLVERVVVEILLGHQSWNCGLKRGT